TLATVKALDFRDLGDLGARMILNNAYHLMLRPGAKLVREMGGLHRFSGYTGAILTDSGGFQVFSLAELRDIDDRSVRFKSHIDGSPIDLSPEKLVEVQEDLGPDVAMVLDECPPGQADREYVQRAVTSASQPQPADLLLQLMNGKWISQAIHAAAKLKIADLLSTGSMTAAELAKQSGANEDSLYRLLRALASVGVFAEANPRTFTSTPMSELLRSNAPGSLRAIAMMSGDPFEYRPWEEVVYSIKTGKPAFDKAFGQDWVSYISERADVNAMFNDAMTSHSELETHGIVHYYDFSKLDTLMDVAGGHGFLLASILAANPKLRGILFDLDHVVAGAPPMLMKMRVADRCKTEAGSFFDQIPQGASAIIMKHIIHDWDDERAIVILKNCRRALPSGGRVLLAEMVVPSGNNPSPAKWLDMQMLIMTQGGRERTEREFEELFHKSGFQLRNIVTTGTPIAVIEGVCQ
ncbi:MAG: tRNA-guanine transglycosylase, partial [Planctomycetota bacterium]